MPFDHYLGPGTVEGALEYNLKMKTHHEKEAETTGTSFVGLMLSKYHTFMAAYHEKSIRRIRGDF